MREHVEPLRVRFANAEGGELEDIQTFYKRLPPKNVRKTLEEVSAEEDAIKEIIENLEVENIPPKIIKKEPISLLIKNLFNNYNELPQYYKNDINNNILNIPIEYFKPSVRLYFKLFKTVRESTQPPQNIALYLYEYFIPFRIKDELQSKEGLLKLVELKRIQYPLWKQLGDIHLLIKHTQPVTEALREFIIQYTDLPKFILAHDGGRRHKRTNRNRKRTNRNRKARTRKN